MSYFNSLPGTHDYDDNGRKMYKLDKSARELQKIICMLNNDKNRLIFLKNYL